PQRLAVPMREQVADGLEVPQRLAHLLRVDGDKAIVQPVAREVLSAGRLALRDLVLVVGKDQVLPAAMHVEGRAQVLLAHRRALDVPARAARAPGAVPGDRRRLARLRRLPEGEVERIALLLAGLDARARAQILQVPFGQLPVPRERAYREIHVAL